MCKAHFGVHFGLIWVDRHAHFELVGVTGKGRFGLALGSLAVWLKLILRSFWFGFWESLSSFWVRFRLVGLNAKAHFWSIFG